MKGTMMTDTVYFSNGGVLDIRGATTMGVHVKEGNNPIGHFGTGLKFSIATLLRTGHDVIIWCGEESYTFKSKPVMIRDKEFQIVTMNDQELGFTTDTGKNWEVWMAYRELRCNAMDEPNWYVTDNDDEGVKHAPDYAGRTNIVIRGEGICRAHRQRDLYFCENRILLHSSPGLGEVRAGGSDYLFYRGVAAYKLAEPSLFTYNIIEKQTLTEDRTLKETWWLPYVVGRIMALCGEKEVIDRAITAPQKTYEHSINYGSSEPSETFFEVARSHRNNLLANTSAIVIWAKKAPQDNIDLVTPTPEEVEILKHALSICQKADPSFDLTLEEVKVAVTLGEGVMGACFCDEIFIARNVIQSLGVVATSGTLLEEWVHRTYKYKDESRSIQNYFLDRLMKLASEKV